MAKLNFQEKENIEKNLMKHLQPRACGEKISTVVQQVLKYHQTKGGPRGETRSRVQFLSQLLANISSVHWKISSLAVTK